MRASSETTAVLPSSVSLHARPAAEFVRTAMGFEAQLQVSANGRSADAKSLLAVLALGATGGTELRLRGEGSDAEPAVEALVRSVSELIE